jgi:hypothetical protein
MTWIISLLGKTLCFGFNLFHFDFIGLCGYEPLWQKTYLF